MVPSTSAYSDPDTTNPPGCGFVLPVGHNRHFHIVGRPHHLIDQALAQHPMHAFDRPAWQKNLPRLHSARKIDGARRGAPGAKNVELSKGGFRTGCRSCMRERARRPEDLLDISSLQHVQFVIKAHGAKSKLPSKGPDLALLGGHCCIISALDPGPGMLFIDSAHEEAI